MFGIRVLLSERSLKVDNFDRVDSLGSRNATTKASPLLSIFTPLRDEAEGISDLQDLSMMLFRSSVRSFEWFICAPNPSDELKAFAQETNSFAIRVVLCSFDTLETKHVEELRNAPFSSEAILFNAALSRMSGRFVTFLHLGVTVSARFTTNCFCTFMPLVMVALQQWAHFGRHATPERCILTALGAPTRAC